MSKFPKSGTTRAGYRYWIDHVNEEGSMCGRTQRAEGADHYPEFWQPDGKNTKKWTDFDILPPNEASELLERLRSGHELLHGRISVDIQVFNEVDAYLKRQAEKPE